MISKLQVARVLADKLQAELQLAQEVQVVEAPPSLPTDYPAAAVWLETFQNEHTQADEILDDGAGNAMIGARYDINKIMGAATVTVGDGRSLYRVGSLRGSGRIWVAGRHPAKRQEMEGLAADIFYQDTGAPSRVMLQLDRPKIGRFTLPWPWHVAAFIEDLEWSMEYAYAERVWSWTHFTVDIDILVAVSVPIVKVMKLLLSNDMDTNVLQPSDINLLLSLEQYTVDSAATLTKI